MQEIPRNPLPHPTIRRYPTYLREIKEMIARGETHVSSAILAEKLGIDPVLVRKDLAMSGVLGKPRRGYPAIELENAVIHALGWDSANDAVLLGVGSLGQALLGYGGFKDHNLHIPAAFDADAGKVGRAIHGVTVRPMTQLKTVVKRLKIRLGILTVPQAAAQSCADKLVEVGIVGIWNFTPMTLNVPDGVTVQNVDLAQSLAVLSHSVSISSGNHP